MLNKRPRKTVETPPRAWGRRHGDRRGGGGDGNTPTGVGKTRGARRAPGRAEKHPHGRGEDRFFLNKSFSELETPPRAWGRLNCATISKNMIGNTPTGVGKTGLGVYGSITKRKHPHGRGEDDSSSSNYGQLVETPPRAWGRLTINALREAFQRNTPTGVGKTLLGY